MKTTVDVLSTPTVVTTAGPRSWLVIENASDTTIYLDLVASGSSPVSTSNGISLVAGEKLTLTGGVANNQITAIHGGSGAKVLRIQGGND
jgi:hypothetical protein